MRSSQQAVRRRRSVSVPSNQAICRSVIDALESRRLLSGEAVSTAIAPILAHTSNAATDSVTLNSHFTNPTLPGTLVTFETSEGNIQVALTDAATPNTVANFLSYVKSGAYNDTIFHRAAFLTGSGTISATNPNDIIQGGGYAITNGGLNHIPTNAPVADEYTSELFGDSADTLAMAKTSEANSATSEWYFNVKDNTSALDTPTTDSNGVTTSYTVFGNVLSGDNVIKAIASLPVYDIDSSLTTVPVIGITPAQVAAGDPITANNLVYTYGIATEAGTTYTATSDNKALVTPKITDGVLSFTYTSSLSGTANITVVAKNLDGTSASTTFPITVPNSATPTAGPVTAAITAPFTVTGTTGSFSVLGPDTDSVAALNPASVTITTPPAHGTATVNSSSGFINYTPAAGYIGPDTLAYTVSDTTGTVSSPATVTLSAVNTPVTVTIGTAKSQSLTFVQPDGTVGHLKVSGGTAVVTFADYRVTTTTASGVVTAKGDGTTISSIVITDKAKTNASLQLISGGPVTVGGITDAGGMVNVIAPNVTLTGTSSIGSGNVIQLAAMNNASLTIAAGFASTLNITTVTNSSITAAAINTIRSSQWLNTNGGNYTLTAPSIGLLNVKGTFAENLSLSGTGYALFIAKIGTPTGSWSIGGSVFNATLGTPGSGWQMQANGEVRTLTVKGNLSNNFISAAVIIAMNVTGTATNSDIETSTQSFSSKLVQIGSLKFGGAVTGLQIIATGNIGTISAPSLTNTRVYAGVTTAVSNNGTIPSATSDIANDAKIAAVVLGRGTNAFANSSISADILGSLRLGDVATSNGGTAEGVSAHKIGSIVARLGTGPAINLGPAQLKSATILAKYITAKKLTLADFGITLF